MRASVVSASTGEFPVIPRRAPTRVGAYCGNSSFLNSLRATVACSSWMAAISLAVHLPGIVMGLEDKPVDDADAGNLGQSDRKMSRNAPPFIQKVSDRRT